MNLMTLPIYTFSYDKTERLLQITLEGMWDEPTLARFTGEMANLAAQVRMTTPIDKRGRILIDLSRFPVQRAEIVEPLAHLLPALGERAGRVALVRSRSALQNRQNQRLLGSQGVEVVATAEEGLAWLREPGGQPTDDGSR